MWCVSYVLTVKIQTCDTGNYQCSPLLIPCLCPTQKGKYCHHYWHLLIELGVLICSHQMGQVYEVEFVTESCTLHSLCFICSATILFFRRYLIQLYVAPQLGHTFPPQVLTLFVEKLLRFLGQLIQKGVKDGSGHTFICPRLRRKPATLFSFICFCSF